MKTLYFLLVSILLVSCNKTETCEQIKYDETFEFRLNDQFCLEDKFEFSINGISDGYCPCNTVCIWQGMMVINLEVHSSTSEDQSVLVNDSDGLFHSDTLENFTPIIVEVINETGDCLETDPKNYKVKMKILK